MWAVVSVYADKEKDIVDANLDLDEYLDELKKILRKVDFDVIHSAAIFRSKMMAEKYLKRLNLNIETKVVPIKIIIQGEDLSEQQQRDLTQRSINDK